MYNQAKLNAASVLYRRVLAYCQANKPICRSPTLQARQDYFDQKRADRRRGRQPAAEQQVPPKPAAASSQASSPPHRLACPTSEAVSQSTRHADEQALSAYSLQAVSTACSDLRAAVLAQWLFASSGPSC